jgi:hypothetical protein
MTETTPPAEPGKKKPNTAIILAAGAILLCCGCIAALLIGQYLLENSDFSLVNFLPAALRST